MNPQSPKLYSLSLLISLLLGGIYMLFPAIGKTYELWFFAIIMLTTGIPHGATDHVVFQHDARKRGQKISWTYFLGTYLGAMLVYSVCWFFFPLLSLGLFILISAFHFGQSQLLFMEWKETHPLKIALYVSWGIMILLGIIGFHWEESMQIIGTLINGNAIPFDYGSLMLILQVSGGLWLLLMLYSLVQKKLSLTALFFELLNVGLILFICSRTSLLFSFAMYFGLWHSLASISHEIKIIREDRPGFDWKTFFKEAIPFSVISFVGIALLILIGDWIGSIVSPFLLFFIAISTLTLPHMVFMQRLYKSGGKRNEQSALA